MTATHGNGNTASGKTPPQGTPIFLEDGTILHNPDGSVMTEEEVEADAEAFERGEWPKPEELEHVDIASVVHGPIEFAKVRGRPKISPKDDDPAETVSFKLPHSQLDKLDRVAKAHGHTRSELLRIAVDRVLEFA